MPQETYDKENLLGSVEVEINSKRFRIRIAKQGSLMEVLVITEVTGEKLIIEPSASNQIILK